MSKPAEVVSLRGGPVAGVVELLEEKLEQAKAGEVRAVAIIGVCSGGTVTTSWSRGDRSYQHELTAGATYLQWRLAEAAFEDSSEA